ncbi:MAG: MBL fold metallo-hydrolase [Clostridia bacterium]|nr:MBL fold metallo-hydrolase [Clostridia bacterium]
MEILYMGTAAEERIPGMFCNCALCQKALKLGGKDIRTRAQALIDGKLLVDFGADTYDHFLKAGRTLWDIQNVLLTHSHPDHLTLEVFSSRNHWMSAETCKYPTLKVYTSAGVIEKIWRVVEARGLEKEQIEKFWEFIPMNYFEPIEIDGYTVTPFPANHARGEQAYIFLIEKDGKSLFYGNDTGTFGTEVEEWLAQNNKYIDLLSLDCTKGDIETPYYGHMSMSQGREIADRFLAQGVIDDKTKLYYTHFAHGCKMTHDELEKTAKEKYGFKITYDGFRLEV